MSEQQLNEKKTAGEAAAAYVKDRMTVGLGTGSTVRYTTERLAERMKEEGLKIQGIPTSHATRELAEELGIPLVSLDQVEAIDVTIDGADEIDGSLNGIKGGGGALLFEKIVASVSRRNIWVGDSGKKVETLGKFPLPVEVVPFALPVVLRKLEHKGMNPIVRENGKDRFVTDSGNWIIDLHLGAIEDSAALEIWLNLLPGVVENGLFLQRADLALISQEGTIHTYERPE
ncbi:MAG TPA: ribose-5-phosphate isomerase RpiA [Bacillales bacterium]|nr:ribose-5-phosphate isomerase RpiA [Bacillales bacterium]